MAATHAGGTRGRLLTLLCAGDGTVAELAEELGITPNATRAHLRQLEEDGLVSHRVVRRGVGKPPHEYALTPLGSVRLSRAYLPLLSGLLEVAGDLLDAASAEALLREAGRAVARRYPAPKGDLSSRVDAAVRVLEDLGGAGSVVREGGGVTIRGACCPVRALVPEHPLACKCLEALLTEVTGLRVRERCVKGAHPSCRLAFEAGNADAADAD